MTLKALIPLPALVMTVAALTLPVPAAYAIPITFELNLSGANDFLVQMRCLPSVPPGRALQQ